MIASHYICLVAGYFAALSGWFVLSRTAPGLWPATNNGTIEKPWQSLAALVVALTGVVAVGQLYVHGIQFPEKGPLKPLWESLNQLAIFAPLLLTLWLRGETLSTVWLSARKLPYRMLAGVALSALALFVYVNLREGAGNTIAVLGRIWTFENLGLGVQVFLEDVAIAALCVRISAAISLRWALVLVPLIFAAGHLPTMLSSGASATEIFSLVLDAGLGLAVFGALTRSRDIVWFWFVHFTMDMTQFHRIAFS